MAAHPDGTIWATGDGKEARHLNLTDDRPGVLKVIIPFTDPEIVGRFVYHCHAVDHEDKGMMGTVLVVI
jgi:FtsP/CotA-like multicopper oxidase with cupredoxin domain